MDLRNAPSPAAKLAKDFPIALSISDCLAKTKWSPANA